MDRIWQWTWDRYSARYSWAVFVVGIPLILPTYLFWLFFIVAVQGAGQYIETAAVAVVAAPLSWYVTVLPGTGRGGLVERWAAGREVVCPANQPGASSLVSARHPSALAFSRRPSAFGSLREVTRLVPRGRYEAR
jgi:hypothetical protein